MADDRAAVSVGFVGLGNIGAPMARRIVDAGYPLTIWARRPQSLEPFRDTPAAVASSLRQLGERSEIVGVCVVDDADVESVLVGDNILAGMKPGGIVAIHSTIHPNTVKRLAQAAGERSVSVLDATVSGGGDGAARGTLCVMVGGDPEAFERCRPVFETFGRVVRHVGPLGSGQLAKLVNNILYYAGGKLVDDAVAIGEGIGLDRHALIDVMQAGSGDSFVLRRYARTASLDFWRSDAGRLKHVIPKDVELLLSVAHDAGVDTGDIESAATGFVRALAFRPGDESRSR